MTPWLFGALVLLIGGFAPALLLGSRRAPPGRLVGLEFASTVTILVLLLLSEQFQQTSYLIVPLALAVAAFPGALVFARLLVPRK